MLTRKQHELVCFINDRLAATGVSPSFEEMKEALDLKSKSGVHRLIQALEERQFIRRLPNRARALEVLRIVRAAVPEDFCVIAAGGVETAAEVQERLDAGASAACCCCARPTAAPVVSPATRMAKTLRARVSWNMSAPRRRA